MLASNAETGFGLKRDLARAMKGDVWGCIVVRDGRHEVVAIFDADTRDVWGNVGPRESRRAN